MSEKKTNEKPKYRGNLQVSAWEKVDKNGNHYLSVKIDQFVNMFPVDK